MYMVEIKKVGYKNYKKYVRWDTCFVTKDKEKAKEYATHERRLRQIPKDCIRVTDYSENRWS